MNHHQQGASPNLPETAPLKSYHPGPKMPSRVFLQQPPTLQQMPWRLRMEISGDSHNMVGLEVKDRILIGRADPESENPPDLNLAPYGGNHLGVSRRHAVIILHENALYLEDLKSTNGTRLNGYLIEPDSGYCLRNGDEMHFGEVRVVIRFVSAPKLITSAPSQTGAG